MSRIVYFTPEVARKYDRDPTGEWMLEEEIPDKWNEAIEDLEPLKSEKVKKLIRDTIEGTIVWKFGWCWFTGGMWFPIFTHVKDGIEYRMQVAWPPKEWGFIVVVTGSDGYFYDSALDDENYVEVGMELLHLAEDLCENRAEFLEEMTKRAEARERGEPYPPVERKEP